MHFSFLSTFGETQLVCNIRNSRQLQSWSRGWSLRFCFSPPFPSYNTGNVAWAIGVVRGKSNFFFFFEHWSLSLNKEERGTHRCYKKLQCSLNFLPEEVYFKCSFQCILKLRYNEFPKFGLFSCWFPLQLFQNLRVLLFKNYLHNASILILLSKP